MTMALPSETVNWTLGGSVAERTSGKQVATPDDVKSGIASAKSQGKKAVMMRNQTPDGARFVAVPFPKA